MNKKWIFYFISSFIFIQLGCKKEPTSWDTNWNFPLFNDTLVVMDWVNDSTFTENSDNSLQVSLDRQIASIDFFDLVEIPDTFINQSFNISIPSLNVPPGTEFVNEEEEHKFGLNNLVITKARFNQGIAKIKILNPIDVDVEFEIELPGVTKNGVVFSQTEVVPPKVGSNPGEGNYQLDLKGYSIDMTGQNGDSYNSLRSRMTVRSTEDSDPTTITNQDIVKFEVDFNNLKLDYAKGYFGNELIAETENIDIDLLNNITGGNLVLAPLDIKLEVQNGIKAKAQLMINEFSNSNSQGSSVILEHPKIGENININSAQGTMDNFTPSNYELVFDPGNSNLNDFVQNLGGNLALDYKIQLNPYGNASLGNDEIFPDSRVNIQLKSDFLLSAGTENLTFVDTFEVDFKNQEETISVNEGEIIIDAENAFPYAGELNIFLLDENFNVIDDIEETKVLNAGTTNESIGEHTSQESQLKFKLTEKILDDLENLNFIKIRVVLNSGDYPENIVYSNAKLILNTYSNFKLRTRL